MNYPAWRISFQSGDQAARAAFNELLIVKRLLAEARDGIAEAIGELAKLRESRDFYARRCEALQAVQDKMRDPERKAVCDILANGSTEAMNGANALVKRCRCVAPQNCEEL